MYCTHAAGIRDYESPTSFAASLGSFSTKFVNYENKGGSRKSTFRLLPSVLPFERFTQSLHLPALSTGRMTTEMWRELRKSRTTLEMRLCKLRETDDDSILMKCYTLHRSSSLRTTVHDTLCTTVHDTIRIKCVPVLAMTRR